MFIKNKRGQSTVEYVLLMTAVVAVVIVMVTSKNSGMQGQLTNTMNSAIGTIGDMSDRLATSQQTTTPTNSTPSYAVNVAP